MNGSVYSNLVRFGEFELDLGAYELRRSGQPVKLARIPMDLLLLLLEQPGQLVTREQIVERVWGKNVFLDTDNGINAVIRRIRQALDDDPDQPRFIQTVVGRGYRFIGSVENLPSLLPTTTLRPGVSDSPAGAGAPEIQPQVKLGEEDSQPAGAAPSTGSGWKIIMATSVLAAALLAVLAVVWLGATRREHVDSIAVLPFANMSGDPDVEYLSDGITEGIINELSQIPQMRVMARSTVFHYKGRNTDAQKVGQDLKVRAVLSGTLARHGDDVRVDAELIDVNSGSELWGEQYHRKLSDIAGVQQEVVRDISDKMKVRLSGEEQNTIGKRNTESWEAYDLYLRGRYQWNKFSVESLHKAVDYFRQAIDKDPTYALAYAGLADAYHELSYYSAPQDVMPKARAAANKALELDDSVAEAHAALGWVKWQYDWDWAGAEKEFQRAIELNPKYAIAHGMYALYLDSAGRIEEARAEHERAQELEPLSLVIGTNAGEALYQARQYDRAIEQYRKTLELDENFGPALDDLGRAYERKAMYKEAAAEWQRNLIVNGDSQTASAIAQAYAKSGYESALHAWLDSLMRQLKDEYVSPYLIATIYARLNQRDQALLWLSKACQDRSTDLVFLKVEPAWDSYRSDPRYLAVEKQVGLTR